MRVSKAEAAAGEEGECNMQSILRGDRSRKIE